MVISREKDLVNGANGTCLALDEVLFTKKKDLNKGANGTCLLTELKRYWNL